ncbi:MAG: diguanylate cyclase [Algicola sp.]|nr:diguanylate cyclase [Algicola sp.]
MKKATKVLVVDDSPVINQLLTENIKSQLHLDVVSAYTMKEAIDAVSVHPNQFFVAILDLTLPDAPHGEVVDALLALGIRPIILTANMSDDLHDEMMAKAIIDYVVKRNLGEMQYVIDQVQRLYENFNRRILIVDDSRLSRKLLRSLLERHNFTVEEAIHPEQGLMLLKNNPIYHLLITDYNMPKMNGAEFIGKVRGTFSRQELAILGVSTVGGGRVSVQMLKAGANDFITRPFMHEEFYCRVNQNIDGIASYQKLKNQAFRDFLTHLYNRRYMFETGNGLYENAKRDNITIATAMIDIDYFKKVNDTYGHSVGDDMLKHVSKMLTKHFRDGDVVARIGGEEFCVLCINVDKESAEALFERLRYRIMATPLEVNGLSISISVTVSIGYTLDLNESFEAMVGRADELLYQAKNNGRNRVVSN